MFVGPFLGVIVGSVLGVFSAWWALRSAPELLPIFAVPVKDRGSGAPGPPVAYWLTWASPPVVFYCLCGLTWWRWRRARWSVVSLAVAFALCFTPLALLWISLDIGGFSPN